MRIAFLTHQWPGVRLGGIGVYSLNCARALAEANHQPHIFTFSLPPEIRDSLSPNITVHEVPDLATRVQNGSLPAPLAAAIYAGGEASYRLALGALLCAKLREVHAQSPFDLVEAPEYEALALPLLLCAIPKLPIITHLHSGSAIIRRAGNLVGSTDHLLFEAMEAAAIVAADWVIAPSLQVIADTKESCPFQTASILALPFYPVTDTAPAAPTPNAPILFIGRVESMKGAHLLPEALNIFLPQFPAAAVRLIGPDTNTSPSGSSMAQWIKSHLHPAIAARVTFVGEQSRQQIAAELARASFVIVPSLHDNYPYVCCEALAAARPVIVSTNIGATEVVADAGLTFERNNPKDLAAAMSKLWADRDLLLQLSALAKQRASTTLAAWFTTKKRLDFYRQAIARGPAQSLLCDRLAKLPTVYIAPLLQAVARLTTFLAGVPDPSIKTPGMRLAAIMSTLAAATNGPAKILLYGAGRHTSRLLAEQHLWQAAGHQIIGLIDDHPRFQNGAQKTHLNLPVETLAQLLARLPLQDPATALVLSTDTFQDQFWQQTAPLRQAGIKVLRLYD